MASFSNHLHAHASSATTSGRAAGRSSDQWMAMDRFRPKALVRALAAGSMLSLAVAGVRAQALPSGATVVNGQARIITTGNKMTVTNSSGAIIDWKTFSIGAGQAVRFDQPNATSQVLNRVVGNDPSNILGSLSSNGRFWLLNPNGVLFGQGARIDVAGIVASTLSLPNSDWLAGRYSLTSATPGMPGADVVNQGEIRTALGGRVALVGGNVRNEGLIEAPGGQVMLAAGQTVDLVDTGAPNVLLRVTAARGEAMNLGTLSADGGSIDVQAAIVNQHGIVRADTYGLDASGRPVLRVGSSASAGGGLASTDAPATVGSGSTPAGPSADATPRTAGTITLRASEALNLAAGSVTSASGGSGGAVLLDSATGTSWVRGAVNATGAEGLGGQIKVLGRQVGLGDGSRIDASGAAGGGEILVGGGQQGKDAGVPNALAVYLDAGASLLADATSNGNGGRVILWGDLATRAYGSLSARGGLSGGNGGFIETSGGWLDVQPLKVDATSPKGTAGTWLLDPYDIFISDSFNANPAVSSPPGIFTPPDTYTSNGPSTQLAPRFVIPSLNAGSNVVIATGSAGTELGNITVYDANLVVAPLAPVSLTLRAHGNIDVTNSNIRSTAAPLSLSLVSGVGGSGGIKIVDSTVTTRGGGITLGGLARPCGPNLCAPTDPAAEAYIAPGSGAYVGISLGRSNFDAGDGRISMRGIHVTDAAHSGIGGSGIVVDGSTLTAKDIDLFGWIDSNDNATREGVVLVNSRLNASRSIRIEGRANSGVDYLDSEQRGEPVGVDIHDSSLNLNASRGDPLAGLSVLGTVGEVASRDNDPIIRDGLTLLGSTFKVTGGAPVSLVAGSTNVAGDFVGSFDADPGSLFDFADAGATLFSAAGVLFVDGGITAPTGQALRLSATSFTGVVGDITGAPSSLEMDARYVFWNSISLTGDAPVTVRAGVAASMLRLQASASPVSLSTGGKVRIFADFVELADGARIESGAPGDAIVLAGADGASNMKGYQFDDAALSAPYGRWLAFATNPTDFGGLSTLPDFKQMDARYGDPALVVASAGNGFLYSLAPTFALSGFGFSKVYDGSTDAGPVSSGFPLGTSGLVSGDSYQLRAGHSGQFADKNAGIDKVVTLDPSDFDFADSNGIPVFGYKVETNLTGTINPKQITLSNLFVPDKVYDGTTEIVGGARARADGIVAGEGASSFYLPAVILFDSKDAGQGITVRATAILVDGPNGFLASNYLAPPTVTTTASITPAPLTITANNAAKLYGNTLVFSGTEFTPTGLVAAETIGGVTLGSAGSAAGASVHGGPYAITASNAQGGSFNPNNYTISYVDGVLTIAPISLQTALVNISGNPTKPYDGTTLATLNSGNFSITGFVLGDGARVTQTAGAYDSKNAGSRTVTASLAAGDFSALGSTDLGNYILPTTASGPGTIIPRTLGVAAISADSKTYDGNSVANISGISFSNLVAGESLSFGGANGRFDSKDAGKGKVVTVDQVRFADATNGAGLASNYQLPTGAGQGSFQTSADIDPKQLGFLPFTAQSRDYDGTRLASVTPGGSGTSGLSGLVGTETLNVTYTGTFDTKNVGLNKSVTVGATVTNGPNGEKAGNYILPPTATTTADITPKLVTLTRLSAQNKTYDGTTAATVTAALEGLVSGEQLDAGFSGSFDTKDAGTGKTVTVQGTLRDGATGELAGNYRLGAPSTTTADILQAALTITADNASKIYGTTLNLGATAFKSSGLIAGESLSTVSLASAGSAATASVFGGPYDIVASGGSGAGFNPANYLVQYINGKLTVTPASLTVVIAGDPTKVFDGTDVASLTPSNFSFTGFVGTDSATVSQSTGRYDAIEPGPRVVTASIGQGSVAAVGATDLRNYTLPSSVSGAGTITPRPPTDQGQTSVPLTAALQQVTIKQVPTSPTEGRTLDAVPAVMSGDGGVSFQTISVAGMSMDALAALLASRDQLKKNLFASSLDKLAQDPKLADLGDCQSLKDLEAGNCIITDQLKADLAEARRIEVRGRDAAATAQAAAPAAPASSTPAQAAKPAIVAKAETASRRAVPTKRKVVKSSLPQIARKVALVIGIDNYADRTIPQLDNAGRDALAVGKVLETQLGYEVAILQNGTKEEIIGALNRLAGEIDSNDSVVVYYAGHGAVVEATGLGYWQPANAVADKPETWISNADINKLIARLGAQQVALISDSCFSGSLITGQRIRASGDLLDPAKVLSQKSVVIMTSGGNEPVSDAGKDGHSPFAWNLMRNLEKVPSWQPGGNVFERVRFAVAKEMPQKPQYAAVTEAGHQAGGDYLFEQRELEVGAQDR